MFRRADSSVQVKPYRSSDLLQQNDIERVLDEKQLVAFEEKDIENPKNWSAVRRGCISDVVILASINTNLASSSPSGCLTSISQEFSISREAAGLTITLFLLAYSAGPLIWAPLSEFYGRRWILLGTFSLYFTFNFLCAFSPTFAGLLVGRWFSGVGASAALANVPGVLVDIWDVKHRGYAMAVFVVGTFLGPALGPIISGFLELTKDWRWTFYVHLWLAGFTLLLLVTVPETLPSQLLLRKARRIRQAKVPGFEHVYAPVEASDRTLAAVWKTALTRPFKILFDPIDFFCAIYSMFVFLLLYMLLSIYPIVFQDKRGWNAGVGQLPLLGVMLGACIGGLCVFLISRRDVEKLAKGQSLQPERRMHLSMPGAVLFPISMFWFAWTANYNSIHWSVPTVAGVFLSISIVLCFVGQINYVTDTYTKYAASALAANSICRLSCAAAAPLFTTYMFEKLTVAGGGSLIAGVACLLAPIPFVFYRYGASIRRRSKFAQSLAST